MRPRLFPEEQIPVRLVGRLVLDRVVDNFFAETEQVAFCTQNVVPGIDFSDDPLLQGRNFSYLDTQLKRLGSPNFTHIPVNAPKCPVHNFQQDGHMAMRNPVGRANYEPNSWGTEQGGPRENPERGYTSFPEEVAGPKVRARSESFADHYSQARQFYTSQTPVEQFHIASALVFELSKVETLAIRERMVAHLLNIDESLAKKVADGLGLARMPEALPPAATPITDLAVSPALSILKNGPDRFEGRKLGVLVTDGTDADLLTALNRQIKDAGGMIELVAPKVGGVSLNNSHSVAAQQKIDGGPSVLYDAVALLVSKEGAEQLQSDAPTRDFIADAFAHAKFIGYSEGADLLLQKAGIKEALDEGCMALSSAQAVQDFVGRLGNLRFWEREAKVDFDAQ